MSEERSASLDLVGLKPVAESVKAVVDGSLSAAGAFLGRICLPAAEEFGLLLRDKVGAWRAANAIRIAEKAQRKVESRESLDTHASPRLVMKVLEEGSWASDDDVQEMWSGLLASSCTAKGDDDSNLLFMNLLSQLTVPEARILKHSCETAKKFVTDAGWITATELYATLDELRQITGVDDFHRLDRELDHLRSLDLLPQGGFEPHSTRARIAPSALALHLYVRSQGYVGSPVEFFTPSAWKDRYRHAVPVTPSGTDVQP